MKIYFALALFLFSGAAFAGAPSSWIIKSADLGCYLDTPIKRAVLLVTQRTFLLRAPDISDDSKTGLFAQPGDVVVAFGEAHGFWTVLYEGRQHYISVLGTTCIAAEH